jgi:DtxR family Mn-dependent transcriptional regulator
VQEFGYAWDEVHDEAEVLEHAISDRLLAGIAERLGHPRFDPHGDAIPDADGNVHRLPFVLLSTAEVGHAGEVLRVSDRDPELLRALEGAASMWGTASWSPERTWSASTTRRSLPAGAAGAVWLTA